MSEQKNKYGLNDQKELFCHQYIAKAFDAGKAALAAGSKSKTPSQIGHAWLQEPEVRLRITQLQQESAKRLGVTSDFVLLRLLEIDEMDLVDIIDDEMNFKPFSEWPRVWTRFLSAIDLAEINEGKGDEKQMVGILKKIKWPDKIKNLEMIGKHIDIGAFRERVTHDGNISASLDDEGYKEVSDRVADILGKSATRTH